MSKQEKAVSIIMGVVILIALAVQMTYVSTYMVNGHQRITAIGKLALGIDW